MKSKTARYPFAPKRPLVFCTLFCVLGLAAGIALPLKTPLLIVCALFCVPLGAVMKKQGKSIVYALSLLLFFLCAIASASIMQTPFLAPGAYTITGIVEGEAAKRENGSVRVTLRDGRAVNDAGEETHFGKAYWTFYPREDETLLELSETLYDGDKVSFTASAYTPSGQVNPYGFDFRLYLLQGGFRAAITGCADPLVKKEASVSLSGWVFRLRSHLLARMDAIFGDDAPWPEALLLGVRDRLEEDTVQAFRDLGIAHILAVSGLHVGLIAAFVQWLLRRLRVGIRGQFIILCLLLLLYAALLQFTASVVRASVLILLASLRRILRRPPDPLSTLALAALVILIVSPLQVMAAGFQLTFAAVLGIFMLREPFLKALRFVPVRAVREALAVTAAASLAVLIPSAALFHSISLAGLLVSPVACLVMAALLPVYILLTVLGAVYLPLGQAGASALHVLTSWMLPASKAISETPYSHLSITAFPFVSACALIGILFLLTRYCILPWKRRLALACAFALLGALIPLMQRDGRVSYIQFSQGQSDAAVIEDGDMTVVIDAGENGSDLAAYLLSVGRRADIVVLTHLHTDHCAGVLDLIADRVEIGKVILAPLAEAQTIDEPAKAVMAKVRETGIPVETMAAGDSFFTERARFDILWPFAGRVRAGQDANDYSMALLCEAEGVRILFTGDLTAKYETYAMADADILKVAHHGSAASTEEAFLAAVTPRLSIVTCRSGQYLPSGATLERLMESGSAILRTDETGAIRVNLKNGAFEITPFLAPSP